jgi:hypothetical protein
MSTELERIAALERELASLKERVGIIDAGTQASRSVSQQGRWIT